MRRTIQLPLGVLAIIAAISSSATSALADTIALSDGLAGYWSFNGDGRDSSGAGRDIGLVGNAGFAPGLVGSALSLPGDESSHASRPGDDGAFDFGGGDFTIQTWVKFNSLSGEQVILEKFDNGPGWTLSKLEDVQDDHRITFIFGSTPNNDEIRAPGLSISDDEWHQYVVARSGSAFSLFFDGAFVADAEIADAIADSEVPLLVGRRLGGQGFGMNGLIDEMAIWSRAVSAGDILSLYQGGLLGFEIPGVPGPGDDGGPHDAVPEPGSLGLLLLSVFVPSMRRRMRAGWR